MDSLRIKTTNDMETLKKLKKYLSEVTKEEFDKHWSDVKDVGVSNGWLIASESNDIQNVSNSTWTVQEIRDELESIDETKAAKYFFDKYGC